MANEWQNGHNLTLLLSVPGRVCEDPEDWVSSWSRGGDEDTCYTRHVDRGGDTWPVDRGGGGGEEPGVRGEGGGAALRPHQLQARQHHARVLWPGQWLVESDLITVRLPLWKNYNQDFRIVFIYFSALYEILSDRCLRRPPQQRSSWGRGHVRCAGMTGRSVMRSSPRTATPTPCPGPGTSTARRANRFDHQNHHDKQLQIL